LEVRRDYRRKNVKKVHAKKGGGTLEIALGELSGEGNCKVSD